MSRKAFSSTALIALAILFSVLSGCTSGIPTATTSATTVATTEATTATETATAAPTTEPTASPTTAPSSKYQFPWTGDSVTLSYFYVDFSYAGMVWDPATKLIDKAFQEAMGNIKIDNQSVGWSDYSTKLDLMFSSGEMPDIIIANGTFATKYGDSGYMLDFSKYLDYLPNYQEMYAKYPATYKKVGDAILAIQQPRDTTVISREWIANDYYVQQGVAIPTNYDEIYTACMKVKELNPSIYPLCYNWDGLFMNDFNTNKSVFYNNDTKKWEFGLSSENFKQYVTFMNKMFTAKLINPDQFDKAWGDEKWNSIITDPHAWFIYSGYNEVNATRVPAMKQKEPKFAVDYMLPPTAGTNTHNWIPIEAQSGTDTWFTYSSAKTKDPEFLCSFLNYMMSDQIGVLVNWGIEGKTFKTNTDGTKSFTSDLLLPCDPTKGTIDPIKTLSLYPHFMCKQLGDATRSDFTAMTVFSVDTDCGDRSAKYAQYIKEHPECAAWSQPIPTLTTDEASQTSKTLTDIATYVDEQVQLFILGKRNLNEWDKFLTEVKAIGDGQAVADLYNSKPVVVLVNN
jgi:putative aldouronate transport system substrate-binding protein